MSRRREGLALEAAEPVFAALGDRTRLRLLARLCDQGPQSIVRLAEGEEVTRQAVTKHLRVLKGAGLVSDARQGRETVWQLEPGPLEDARRYLDRVSEQWDRALERLRTQVEDEG